MGAEIYAAGGIYAFPVLGPPGNSERDGTLPAIVKLTDFYINNTDLYKNIKSVEIYNTGVWLSAPNVTKSVAIQQKQRRKIVHLINHNFDNGALITQKDAHLTIRLHAAPASVKIVSPDFTGEITPDFVFDKGILKLTVPSLDAYDAVVISEK